MRIFFFYHSFFSPITIKVMLNIFLLKYKKLFSKKNHFRHKFVASPCMWFLHSRVNSSLLSQVTIYLIRCGLSNLNSELYIRALSDFREGPPLSFEHVTLSLSFLSSHFPFSGTPNKTDFILKH